MGSPNLINTQANYDPNILAPPPLNAIEDLKQLIQGHAVHPPDAVDPITPARFIVFEDGFCRDLDVLNPLIDFSVHIDIPLDISLCRVLVRTERKGNPMEWVHTYLNYSLHYFYDRLQKVGERANMVVDGLRPEKELAEEVTKEIQSRFA